jgi:hypothetical protein
MSTQKRSDMKKNEKDIQGKIEAVKKKIIQTGNFRPGSLSTQYNVCGKQGCKCKDKLNPKKHGPYYQLSFYGNKKHTTRFVKKHNLKTIEIEIKNYKSLKQLFDEWIQLSIEQSNLRITTGDEKMKK